MLIDDAIIYNEVIMTKFDEIYKELVSNIMNNGITEFSERTGHETRTIVGAHFQIDIEKDGFPLLTTIKTPIKMFVAEQIWFVSGARKPEDFLRDYTHIWDEFTNPGDVVTVAYGYRWRKHFGRDQLGLLIELLKNEPSSRQAVVVTWDPAQDGLSLVKKRNVPCPYTFTVNIVGGRLHLHNIVRSNDIMLGCRADVAGFALLQCMLAQKLGVRPGIYSHSISNAHIYDTHFEGAKELMTRINSHGPIKLTLPPDSFDRAEKKDPQLLEEVVENIQTQYNPMEQIKGLKLIL
jgi:thymidylate synthase